MVKPEESQITSQYSHTRCMLDKEGYTYTRTHTHVLALEPGTPHARLHTHRQICNTCSFFSPKKIRERASMLRYTNLACLVQS